MYNQETIKEYTGNLRNTINILPNIGSTFLKVSSQKSNSIDTETLSYYLKKIAEMYQELNRETISYLKNINLLNQDLDKTELKHQIETLNEIFHTRIVSRVQSILKLLDNLEKEVL